MVHVIVCLKLVIDPEMPFSLFRVAREEMKPIPPEGMPPVISPFDENALEAALRIKDQNECRVTVLSLGKTVPKAVLQKVMALGVDEAIALEDPKFEHLDPYNLSRALASAIEKIRNFDLIFTGRQGADWDAGITWAGIAELLDIPSVTIARKVEVVDGKAVIQRCVSDGVEVIETDLPVLVTFSNEAGELRYVSLKALMKAKKYNMIKWSALDIGLEMSEIMELTDLYLPELADADCIFMPGESNEEKGRNLAKKCMEGGLFFSVIER